MAKLTLRDYLQNTEDAISSGRIEDAFGNCQYILTHFPDALEAQRLLGEVYLAQGNLDEAQQTFDWVLTNDPENVIAYCDRALISERRSDFDTALDCYQQAYELSRGNSQIRQEFNKLSEQIGQPGFMFSRAGLARLYMRGDLLPEAIQEWEAVLTASPDRLDGRIGLLEACWRENSFERVEELATQLLEEVPGCLKALLLLAHVTSSHNIQRAQEYIQRAKALDPEMVMARELFSDLIASQPGDPFLALFKKEPVVIPETANSKSMPVPEQAPKTTNGNNTGKNVAFTDSLLSWSGLDTLIPNDQNYQPTNDAAALLDWSKSNSLNVDQWATLAPQNFQALPDAGIQKNASQNHLELDGWSGLGQSADLQLDAWANLNEAGNDIDAAIAHDQALLEQQPWFKDDQFADPTPGSVDPWSSLSNPAPNAYPSTMGNLQDDQPAPPAWLDMLTKNDHRQPSGPTPSVSASTPLTSPSLPPASEPVFNAQATWGAAPQMTPDQAQQDEESFFFGPEWLKSLGAASISMDNPIPIEPSMPIAPVQPVVNETVQPTPAPMLNWTDQLSNLQPPATVEENVLTTLETLEKSLFSQGFQPLEPGKLSAIAKEQEADMSLSSALAQLGNLTPQPTNTVNLNLPVEEAMPFQADTQAMVPPSEPWWASSAISEASQSQIPAPAPVAPVIPPVQPNMLPAAQFDMLQENELEATMKRPAIRLQPMQKQPNVQQNAASLIGKDRSIEHADGSTGGELPYKDRLRKGYQYQLSGAYDEAMQEYRAIIRGAPELVGEVISNTRALLKLAPKYTAGYRVLGDAYMRQGEYLQAMEAYNKALSMAKKAKN